MSAPSGCSPMKIWSFVCAKAKNVATAEAAPAGAGDCWTWTAMDAENKLMISWLVGGGDPGYATELMQDLAARLCANRVQLTTDRHKTYLEAVEAAFGADVDYGMLVKLYGETTASPGRYSPPDCADTNKTCVEDRPDRISARHTLIGRT